MIWILVENKCKNNGRPKEKGFFLKPVESKFKKKIKFCQNPKILEWASNPGFWKYGKEKYVLIQILLMHKSGVL